jgi:hypothetical protein
MIVPAMPVGRAAEVPIEDKHVLADASTSQTNRLDTSGSNSRLPLPRFIELTARRLPDWGAEGLCSSKLSAAGFALDGEDRAEARVALWAARPHLS